MVRRGVFFGLFVMQIVFVFVLIGRFLRGQQEFVGITELIISIASLVLSVLLVVFDIPIKRKISFQSILYSFETNHRLQALIFLSTIVLSSLLLWTGTPSTKYYLQLYNCDDVCELFVPGQGQIHHIALGDKDENEWTEKWIDITEYVQEEKTLTLRVSNIGGWITYGIRIRENEGPKFILNESCGTVRMIGCPTYENPSIGVAAEFVYTLPVSK